MVSTPTGRKSKYVKGKPPPAKPPAEAEQWIRQTITAVEQGRYASAGRLTVAEQVAEWYRLSVDQWAPETARTYAASMRHIAPIGKMRLDALTPQTVQRWLNDLRAAGVGSARLIQARSVLAQACKAAVIWGIVATNPVACIKPPRYTVANPRRPFTADERQRFLAAIQGDDLEPFWLALMFTGMRQGEARGLTWDRVDFDTRAITVAAALDDAGKRTGSTKTQRTLSVPMVPSLERALRAQRAEQIAMRLAAGSAWPKGDWVFTTSAGKPWTGQTIRKRLAKLCAAASLEHHVPHEFRHSAVTVMHEAGIPLGVISAIVGHSTVRTTLGVYFHHSDDELRKAVAALDQRVSR